MNKQSLGKDTRRARRVEDHLRAGDPEERELEFFNKEFIEDIHCSNPQVLHHVIKHVLGLFVDERVSFSKWIKYNNYINIHELCEELPCRLKDLHEYRDYIVDEQPLP